MTRIECTELDAHMSENISDKKFELAITHSVGINTEYWLFAFWLLKRIR